MANWIGAATVRGVTGFHDDPTTPRPDGSRHAIPRSARVLRSRPRKPGRAGLQSAHSQGGHGADVAQPVVRSTMQSRIVRLRTAAERERHDMVDLQPIPGTAAPPAVPVDTAATTPVAAPHLPPHGCRDVPGPGAPQRAEAAQLRKVPLHGRRTPHRPHRANPGGVLKPLRRRTREPVAAPHRSPRHAAFAGFEMQPRRVGCAPEDTAHPRAPAIAVGSSLPLRQRSSPTAAATHRLRWPARVLRLATASRHRIGGATKALRFLDVRILLLPDSVRLRSGTSAALRGRRGGRAIGDRSRTAVHADAGEGRTSDGDSDGQPKVQLSELVTSAPHPRLPELGRAWAL